LQPEALGLGHIIAFHLALAADPAERFRFHEAIRGVRRTGGFAAARAMAIHEPLERHVHFILDRFAKTASMRGNVGLPWRSEGLLSLTCTGPGTKSCPSGTAEP